MRFSVWKHCSYLQGKSEQIGIRKAVFLVPVFADREETFCSVEYIRFFQQWYGAEYINRLDGKLYLRQINWRQINFRLWRPNPYKSCLTMALKNVLNSVWRGNFKSKHILLAFWSIPVPGHDCWVSQCRSLIPSSERCFVQPPVKVR